MSASPSLKEVPPYSVLAAGYDVVMEHVDYELWAEFTHHIISDHCADAQRILELGCGTGSFGIELQALGGYQYVGTDASPDMIRVAKAKAEMLNAPVQFEVSDFTNFKTDRPVDVVVLLYDGLNYVLETPPIGDLLRCVYSALRPGGLFFFDQSTPANSLNNGAFFEDEGDAEGFSFVRKSHYDADKRLHTTTFDLSVEDRTFHERHVQRAYDKSEIEALIRETRFETVAAMDSFSTAPATEKSERVHWLLRKPARRAGESPAGPEGA